MSKHMSSGHMSPFSHGRTHQVPCAAQTKSGSRHALANPTRANRETAVRSSHPCRNPSEIYQDSRPLLCYSSDYLDDLSPSQLSDLCTHTCQSKTHKKTSTMAAAAAVYPPLDQRPVKNTVLLFDVDDTLTKPRQVRTLDAYSAMLL